MNWKLVKAKASNQIWIAARDQLSDETNWCFVWGRLRVRKNAITTMDNGKLWFAVFAQWEMRQILKCGLIRFDSCTHGWRKLSGVGWLRCFPGNTVWQQKSPYLTCCWMNGLMNLLRASKVQHMQPNTKSQVSDCCLQWVYPGGPRSKCLRLTTLLVMTQNRPISKVVEYVCGVMWCTDRRFVGKF